ncbi:hypothetical protein HKD37_06G016558 [Glycine soja]
MQSPPSFSPCTVVYSFEAVFHVDRIEYNGASHFIKLRKNGQQYYLADGLKDFRRNFNIHEGVLVHFVSPDNYFTFYLDFMPPLHRQSCGRPPTTTRKYVFTVNKTDSIISKPTTLVKPYAYDEVVVLLPTEAVDFVDASRPCITVQHRSGVCHIWTISMHNGVQYVDDPWHRFLTDNDLMGGDEVVFYYRPNGHNYIDIPLNYHINWYPKYPTYVYENVVIRFVAPNKNTTFHVFLRTPRYRQPSTRSTATTRRHVFTVDVNEDMMQHKNPLVLPPEAFKYLIAKNKYKRYMNVQHSCRRRCLWKINVQNGVLFVADPWYHNLSDNDLMSGDEVVFYYTNMDGTSCSGSS